MQRLHRRSRRPLRLRIGGGGGSAGTEVVELTGGAGLQVRQIAGADRQIQNAALDALEIDAHRLGGALGGRLPSAAGFFSAAGFSSSLPSQAVTAVVGEDDRRRCACGGCRSWTGRTSRAPGRHRWSRTDTAFAASVEHRLADLGEAIGDRERLPVRANTPTASSPAPACSPCRPASASRATSRRSGSSPDRRPCWPRPSTACRCRRRSRTAPASCRCRPACGCRATTSGPSSRLPQAGVS